MEFQKEKKSNINVATILQSFAKIHAGLQEKYLSEVEKQMSIIMPLPESEVVTMSGYDETENKMSITFFVSKPQTAKTSTEHKFMETITALMMKTDIDKLKRVHSCLSRLEKKGAKYQINGTETEYSKRLGDYTFYLFISKI